MGAGGNFTRKVSNSNTLPIQIYLTLVETSGGTTSVGLWFRSLLRVTQSEVPMETQEQSKHEKPPRVAPRELPTEAHGKRKPVRPPSVAPSKVPMSTQE